MAAELLAISVCRLFPEAKMLNGGPTTLGFYYRFLLEQPIDEEILALVEREMKGIAKQSLSFFTSSMMSENATLYFDHLKQFYLAKKAREWPKNLLPLVRFEEFADITELPEGITSSDCGVFRLLEADRQGKEVVMSGIAFSTKEELKAFVKNMKQAKATDHRRLGVEMGIFTQEEGKWDWTPKGMIVRERLLEIWRREHPTTFYLPTCSYPNENPVEVHLKEFLKHLPPLELPMRYSEMRREIKKESFDGMFAAPYRSIDYVDLFCLESQLSSEIISSLHLIEKTIKIFGFRALWSLQMGWLKQQPIPKSWQLGYQFLKETLDCLGYSYSCEEELVLEEEKLNGPTIQLYIMDGWERKWATGSIGFDNRFSRQLSGFGGERIFLLNRSLFGSLERFAALLVERKALTLLKP